MGTHREIASKLTRAEKHFNDLDLAIRMFWESKPYILAAKPHPITEIDHVTLYVETLQPLPEELSLIIGDVVHNLRSTLDHIAYQLVLANGQEPSRNTEFPIGDPAKEYTTSTHGAKVKGMATEAKELIRSLQPRNTGDMTLWRLHCLDIADKHRLLITTQHSLDTWSAGPLVFDSWSFALSQGDSVVNIPRPTYERLPLDTYKITLDLVFGETEISAGESVLLSLRKMIEAVNSISLLF